MEDKKEIDPRQLKDGTCQLLKTTKGTVAVCKEDGKIKVYPIED